MRNAERLCIRNATIYDGSGRPPRDGDLVLEAGRIVELAPPRTARSGQIIDATGLCACPGFIDIHSHSDMALAHPQAPDLLSPFLLQGITTQVIGNCGLGVAPAPSDRRELLAAFMGLIMPAGVEFGWQSFDEYLRALERRGTPLNVVPLAAHGALRCAVMGSDPGPARGEQLERIGGLLREALEAGAFGLSAGLIYPPGMWADTDELVHLCEFVKATDGLFACHVRGSSELAIEAERELLEIGKRTGVRLQHSHHEAFGPGYWHLARETLRMEDAARRGGIDVGSDVIPYHAVNTTLLAIYPPWALEGGAAALCKRLGDPDRRQRIEAEINDRVPRWPPWNDGWAHNLVRAGGWDNIVVLQARSEQHSAWIGRNLSEIARREHSTPFECAADLTRASVGEVMARFHAISGAPGDDGVLRELLTHSAHAVGVDVILKGEGASHPGGRGAMPRLLGHYARQQGWFGLSEAIRKATSLPASRLRLRDRGCLAAGFAADIVVFDRHAIADTGTYDMPGGRPLGIHAVVTNGRLTVLRGRRIAERAGKVLRYHGAAGLP